MGTEKTIGHRGLVVNAFPMNGFCAAVSRIEPAGETSGRTFNPVTEVSQRKLLTVILDAVNIRFSMLFKWVYACPCSCTSK